MKPWERIKDRIAHLEARNEELYRRIVALEREKRRQEQAGPGTLLWMDRRNREEAEQTFEPSGGATQ